MEYNTGMTRTVTLFRVYAAQRGLFARLSKRLGLDPSYISRVANGKRRSKRVSLAIEAELGKMFSANRTIAKSSRHNLRHPTSRKLPRAAT